MTKNDRRGMVDGNLFPDQSIDRRRKAFFFESHRIECRTVQQGTENIHHCSIAATGGKKCEPIIRAEMQSMGIISCVMQNVSVVLDHALRRSRGTRSVQDIS